MRDCIRIYIDSGTDSREDPQAKAFIAQIVENGWTMAKIDVDDARDPSRFDRVNWIANNAEIDHMLDKVAFMRESLPKTIGLAVDMHGRYDLPTAKRFEKEVEPFKLVWLEEPVPRITSMPCAMSANPRTRPFVAARTFTCDRVSGSCSRKRP